MKTHTTTTTTYTIPGTEIEVELPFKPSWIMDHSDPLVRITDDKIILGYLTDDSDVDNPCDNDDYMGHIYEARRRGDTLGDYCRALGLREDGGGPLLDLVNQSEVVKRGVEMVLADPKRKEDALAQCRKHYSQGAAEDDDYLLWHLDSISELAPIIDTDALLLDLWREGRKNGTIGNKYAVKLDVYEHGGISYSLSGTGMQCQFDTARGGAVWVPNENCVEEIKRRGEVYRKGDIDEMRDGRFKVQTLNETLLQYSSDERPYFDKWYQAFDYLKDLDWPHQRDLATAEHIAAREMARDAAKTYTDWRNGNCFSVVVATYDKAGNEVDTNIVGGFIGDDHAYEALKNDYFPKEPDDVPG